MYIFSRVSLLEDYTLSVNEHLSDPSSVNMEVLQGSILFLLLFLPFLNDLFTRVCHKLALSSIYYFVLIYLFQSLIFLFVLLQFLLLLVVHFINCLVLVFVHSCPFSFQLLALCHYPIFVPDILHSGPEYCTSLVSYFCILRTQNSDICLFNPFFLQTKNNLCMQ